MENGIFVGLSRQMALERQMDLIANNIANISTPAFKGERMVFVEYLAPTDDGETLSYVQDLAQMRNTAEGSFAATGNTFDLAIKGEGYFVVRTDQGDRYTRNGHFTLDDAGELTTSDGLPVLDSSNQPIVIPEDAVNVTVAKDGTISAGASEAFETSTEIGQVQVVTFADEQQLALEGDTLYSTDQPPLPAPGAQILQGMAEESNVQPVSEITRMIATHRAYEATQNMLNIADDLEKLAIEVLTRVA
jgi:flagellar basal-body rod protein FlgF